MTLGESKRRPTETERKFICRMCFDTGVFAAESCRCRPEDLNWHADNCCSPCACEAGRNWQFKLLEQTTEIAEAKDAVGAALNPVEVKS
jgi:hypothetical protein